MSFNIPPAAAGNNYSNNVQESKAKARAAEVEEIKEYELSDEEAELGRAKRGMFEAGIRDGKQIVKPVPRTYAKEDIDEPEVPAAIVTMAIDLGELFTEQLSQIEAAQLLEFLKNWAEFVPEQKDIVQKLFDFFQKNPNFASTFIQDVLDCHPNADKATLASKQAPEQPSQGLYKSSINTDWGAAISGVLLEKLPPVDIMQAYKAFLQQADTYKVEKKEFAQAEMHLLYRMITFMFLLQHFDKIQILLDKEVKSDHVTPFIDYLNNQQVGKNIFLLHQELQKKVSNCLSAYFHCAAALEDVLQLLDTIAEASIEQREELSNYIALQDDIGDNETECALWNEWLAAKKTLPADLAKILLEKVQIMASQPK